MFDVNANSLQSRCLVDLIQAVFQVAVAPGGKAVARGQNAKIESSVLSFGWSVALSDVERHTSIGNPLSH